MKSDINSMIYNTALHTFLVFFCIILLDINEVVFDMISRIEELVNLNFIVLQLFG